MITPVTFAPTGPEGFLDSEGIPLPADTLVDGSPVGQDHLYYERPEANLQAGIWRSAPYTEWYDAYPCDEFMYVLSGHVYIENAEISICYEAGSAFLLPRGFQGYWRQPVDVVKYYVIVN